MRLQKGAVTRATVQLAPRATAWMAVSAEVAQPSPPLIVTAHVGAEVHRGIAGTRALVGRRHRLGPLWKRWRGMVGLECTHDTVRLLRQALEGCGFVDAFVLALGGHRYCRWWR